MLDRRNEGFLEGVLSKIEIAEDANQRGQNPTVRLAKYELDGCFGRPSGSGRRCRDYCCQTGRISTEPFRAWGILAAQPIASSK